MQKYVLLKKNRMIIRTNHSLLGLNTFGFDVHARHFATATTLDDIREAIDSDLFRAGKHLILSGGSNVLFTSDFFDGMVLSIDNKGIETIDEDSDNVFVRVQAGEIWDDFVRFCVSRNLHGVENLSGIPGKVGAAPVQNIGAYGAEAKDSIHAVHALDTKDGSTRCFSNTECGFGYRRSIFKTEFRNRFVIHAVDFRLRKGGDLNLEYGNIKTYLEAHNIANPTLAELSDTIRLIRDSKLPDVKAIGSAGSFFKNPSVGDEVFARLSGKHPEMPSFAEKDGKHKIPAGWLIDRCGWKGYREGNVGVYDKQALVLVHFGNGKGSEIVELSKKIQESVRTSFGIDIEPEVNFID